MKVMETTETQREVETVRRETGAPERDEEGLRFEDPYWDDAFCAWWDPALRTCCS
jgi:hypothetical protein